MEIKNILLIILMLYSIYDLYYFLLEYNLFNLYSLTTPTLIPLKIFKKLLRAENFKKDLVKIRLVYRLFKIKDQKQYKGSSLNIYERRD